jgi:hypothetical protein
MGAQAPMVWISGGIAAILLLGMAIYLRSMCPSTLIRLQLAFTESRFRSIVDRWSPEFRARFRNALVVDVAFLCAYAVFGYGLGRQCCSGKTTPLAGAAEWLLPLAAVADLGEDVLQHRLLRGSGRTPPGSLYALSSVFASTKWMLILAFTVVVLVCGR